MKLRRAFFLLLIFLACAPRAGVEMIPAAPGQGFNYPYLLRLPPGPPDSRHRVLLVEPNNTGRSSDDPNVHLKAARKLTAASVGAFVARELDVPLLVPVFPRPRSEWQFYTHQLDRDAMLLESGSMRRLDLQLIAMIDDARARLRDRGIAVPPNVLLTGFSASGSFSNRFTLLHPERVLAVASGGLCGLLVLPLESLDSLALPYPLGIADFEEVAGSPPRLDLWRRVPQFIYMGTEDRNDAVPFKDGYSDSERVLVSRVLGERMQPDRWERCQALYRAAGANATFRTYTGIGHETNRSINTEIAGFLRRWVE